MAETSERIVRKTQKFTVSKYGAKRVAAYARVSSGKDMALHSLEAQTKYYRDYINNHRGWEFVQVYTDEGISGTKEDRPGFQQMMADARAGKIDLILTKALSRFARNTLLLLDAIRELKLLGVDVYFEKENVHTLSTTGEIMLTVIASFAEEEARSASLNQLWRIKRMFEEGRPTPVRLLGYRMENEQLQVIPEEAEIVRKIYDYYLSGMGKGQIVRKLKEEGITTMNGKKYCPTAIFDIIDNEKYAGDMLLQKTYRKDFRTKKKTKNNGEKPKYFVEDSHEAIIDKETWKMVQVERGRRKSLVHENSKCSYKNKNYPFTSLVVCQHCGKHFVRRHRYKRNYVWICRTYDVYGKDACSATAIPENILEEKTKEALNAILPELKYDELTQELLREHLSSITAEEKDGEKMLKYHFKNGKTYTAKWDFISRSKSWTPEMKEKARQRTLARYKNNKINKEVE